MNLEVLVKEIETYTGLTVKIISGNEKYGVKFKTANFNTSTDFFVGEMYFASLDGYEWCGYCSSLNDEKFNHKFTKTDLANTIEIKINNQRLFAMKNLINFKGSFAHDGTVPNL